MRKEVWKWSLTPRIFYQSRKPTHAREVCRDDRAAPHGRRKREMRRVKLMAGPALKQRLILL